MGQYDGLTPEERARITEIQDFLTGPIRFAKNCIEIVVLRVSNANQRQGLSAV